MLKRTLAVLTLFSAMLMPGVSAAAAPSGTTPVVVPEPGTAASKEAIKELTRWVNPSVIVAAYLDLENTDLAAAIPATFPLGDAAGAQGIPKEDLAEMNAEMTKAKAMVAKWRTEFVAAGGRRVIVIFRMTPQGPEPAMIFPTDGKSNTAKMKELLGQIDMKEDKLTELEGALTFSDHKLKGFPVAEPTRTEDLAAAAAVIAPSHPALAVYFVPSPDQLAIMQGLLKQALTSGPVKAPKDVEKKIAWAALAVTAPPALSLRLVVKGTNNAGAADIAATENMFLALLNTPQIPESPFKERLKLVKAVAAGDTVEITIDNDTLVGTVGVILPALGKARQAARQAVMMSNGRQLLVGMMSYAADHKDAYPESLEAMIKDGGLEGMEKVLTNPSGTKWIYVKPAKSMVDVKFPTETMVIHESFTDWPRNGLGVGYADGHIQVIKDKAEFDKLKDKK